MAKDFIYGDILFNFNLKSKHLVKSDFKLFDKYWNFGINNCTYEVDKSSTQFKELLFNKRGDSEVYKIQNNYMNIHLYLK